MKKIKQQNIGKPMRTPALVACINASGESDMAVVSVPGNFEPDSEYFLEASMTRAMAQGYSGNTNDGMIAFDGNDISNIERALEQYKIESLGDLYVIVHSHSHGTDVHHVRSFQNPCSLEPAEKIEFLLAASIQFEDGEDIEYSTNITVTVV